ncbi:MAG TPA: TCR/Tet family MFS transporter [Povalibacter sp.]|uniref:TCR/Tet family MFS transporter n=1 Tax=Povalibacter sp. TaxID=1962978 RepID=UPI002C77EB31|nr:TCR/Tet family MFS transporter [Povalibacter sp.]HMN45904.1 TCR/Tet family MFS transporter [Povalibacter sp.]
MTADLAGRKPLAFIFVTRLIDAIGFGIVMPVLPQLLLSMGAPDIAAATRIGGYLLVTYAVLQFFCGPIVGNLSDRFGRRPVILVSLFAYGVDYALMGFAPSIFWLFIGRMIAGIAGAVYVPASAFVADVTPPEKRAHAFGLVSSAFGLGFILGPGIGGLLGELGPRAPFFAAAALAGANFLFGVFVLPESLPRERRRAFDWRRANPLGVAALLKHHPAVLVYALAMTAYFLGNNVYPSTWAFFMTAKFDWSPGMIGLSLMATGVTMAVVQATLTGRMTALLGGERAALLGLSLAAASALGYALVPAAWMVFVVILFGALQAITYPSLNALMSRQIPADAQGELQGGLASLTSIANVAGPLLMTQTLGYFTSVNAPAHFPGAAFVLAAAINTVGAVLIFSQMRRGREEL